MVGINKLRALLMFILIVPVALYGLTGTVSAYTTQNVLGSTDSVLKTHISTSTTGRYITFDSGVSTLVSPDTNNKTDAFIKDTESGVTSLLSVTPSGDSGNGVTDGEIMITGNGRYALFSSEATNLASTAGGYGAKNLYLRDLHTSTTYLIAAGSYSYIDNYPMGLSEDGRFIYYTSTQSSIPRLYVLDRSQSTTERVDVNDAGDLANGSHAVGGRKQVSCDGRFVVFSSGATNLVPGDTNGYADIFIVDRMGGHTIKNITLGADYYSTSPKISCDGNYVLFSSGASNLVSSDTNNTTDLFRYKVSDGTLDRVSVKNDGSEYAGSSYSGGGFSGAEFDLSMDSRYIFFVRLQRTTSSDVNYLTMRDTVLGTTTDIASVGSNYYPWRPATSYDGSKVFYVAANNKSDAFGILRVVTGHLN
jgi:hypothetical protein